MAKTIKFNLICDGKPVRTLDDLRNNFCVEDIITCFRNGLLERWLTVRGFTEELESLKKIAPGPDLKVICELAKIFGVDDALTDIERDTYIFTYKKEHEERLARYEAQEYKRKSIIDDYLAGYEALIDTIIDHKDDMPTIKAAVKEIGEKYYTLLCMHAANLTALLLNYAPMAIFAMMMDPDVRGMYNEAISHENKYLNFSAWGDVSEHNYNYFINYGFLYTNIFDMLKSYNKLKEILGDNLKEFAGVTDGYWKDIEPKGRKFMILRMEAGNFVRPSGQNGADMSADDLNGKFPILDGIDYKSNSQTQKLLYVEV